MARLATEGASERDAMLKKGIEGISSGDSIIVNDSLPKLVG